MDAPCPSQSGTALQSSDASALTELERLRTELAAVRANEEALKARLAAQQQLLDGLGQHVPGGLIVLNLLSDGRRTASYASAGVYTLFDVSTDITDDPEVRFHTLVSRVHPDYLPQIAMWEAAAALGEPELSGEFLVVRSDGEERWVALQAGLQVSGADKRTWFGMLQDVTASRKMARRLEEKDVMLKSMGQNLPGVLFKLEVSESGQAKLKYVSAQVRQIYELSDDVEKHDFAAHYNLIHPDDRPTVHELLQRQVVDTLKPVSFEYRVQLPTRGLRWVAGQALPRLEEPGCISWYGYTSDVTDQKLYAQAVISAQAADQANRAKSDFLSRMSHELRTPLNAVIGFAQLLLMDRSQQFGEAQRHHVRLIEKSGKHLLSVLSDVLDLSRIEGGSLPLTLAPHNCASVMSDAVEMVSELARRHRISLSCAEPPEALFLQADRVRLRQVLVNLLVNAIKYNRANGKVRLSGQRQGDGIVLEVADTGIGMDEHQLGHLFEPFNRLGAEQLGIDGTGIGLVIVQRLANMMHGQITALSQKGKGSIFRLTLPVAQGTAVDSAEMPLSEDVPPTSKRSGTILYAEDNEVNVMLVQEVVRMRPQWQLKVGRNGAQALALAQQSHPDLLLVDMHLGDMTGFDLANALDQDEKLKSVPRIALSADAMPDRIHAAKERGFKAYLTKPLDVLALLRCLDESMPSN